MYFQSAKGGNPNAQFQLGYCYQHGVGMVKDYKRAFKWYLRAAEGGNSNAQKELNYDGNGTDEDKIKVFELYSKSVNVKEYDLGYKYERGDYMGKDEI